MMGIHKKFIESLGHAVTSAQLWEHLASMYNLTVLDESQGLPFDNNVEEFTLPDEILNTEKEIEKPKDSQPEQPREPQKLSSTGTAKEAVSKIATPAKSARKRTRTTPGQSGGAVGPGSKRKRH